jgi:hypothetical protein
MSSVYDQLEPDIRVCYNPDGSMQEWFKNSLIKNGEDEIGIKEREESIREQMKEIEDYQERMEKQFQKYTGSSFREWQEASRDKTLLTERRRKQENALKGGADLSELPYDMDVDEYYDYFNDPQ